MQIDQMICRINTLYKKQKTSGLTPEEAEEQRALRRLYLDGIRTQLKGELDSIIVEEADGSRHPLQKTKETE